MSTIDACRHFDNISIPSITWRLNTTTPQNKRDKPGSSFSVDMACQAYGCLTRQGYGKSLFRFPDPVKKKELYLTWLTNLSIEESFTNTKHKLVCEDHFETLFIFLIILNIWIYYTITFCRFTFCFYRYAYGKTNESGEKVRP